MLNAYMSMRATFQSIRHLVPLAGLSDPRSAYSAACLCLWTLLGALSCPTPLNMTFMKGFDDTSAEAMRMMTPTASTRQGSQVLQLRLRWGAMHERQSAGSSYQLQRCVQHPPQSAHHALICRESALCFWAFLCAGIGIYGQPFGCVALLLLCATGSLVCKEGVAVYPGQPA